MIECLLNNSELARSDYVAEDGVVLFHWSSLDEGREDRKGLAWRSVAGGTDKQVRQDCKEVGKKVRMYIVLKNVSNMSEQFTSGRRCVRSELHTCIVIPTC